MSTATDMTIAGEQGAIVLRHWPAPEATRVLVIAHGIGEHSGRYEHVAQRLVADGASVYAPDHHGHGRSDGEPGLISSIEPMAEDLATVIALAQSENPGLPVILLGHSLGGIISTRYVQRSGGSHPLSALVLTGPAIGGNPGFEMLLAMDPLPDVPIDTAILSRDPAVGEAYSADPLVYPGPLNRTTLEAIFASVEAIAAGPTLGSLPTLWLHGEEDQLAPLGVTREAIEKIRGARLEEKVYPGAQHEILNETNKDEVLDDIARFIASV